MGIRAILGNSEPPLNRARGGFQMGEKFAPFTYYHLDGQRPLCGTVHNVASAEMLYCSSTSGEHFEKRAREIARYSDVVEAIAEGANPSGVQPPYEP